MSETLAGLVQASGEVANLKLWLKSSAYTRRLLLGGAGDPWESASQYLAYFSQAHGLLKPDVAVIEVGELFDSLLQRQPALKVEMSAKRKVAYPLRKLLEQQSARELLAEVISAVVSHLRGQAPVVLAMPSPRDWLQQANHAAGRENVELDEGSIEDSAMYVADLLRSVSSSAVSGVLLEEAQLSPATGAINVELYRPLINVAKHYRWPLVLRLGTDLLLDGPALADFDIFIGRMNFPAAGRAHGLDLSDLEWTTPLPALQSAQFYFLQIAADALPEAVLDHLANLKA